MEVYKTFAVEAARSLPHLPDDHPCKRIHGHSFKITITVNGQINEDTGFVMDFSEIDSVFSPIHEMIDHAYLNEIKGLENLNHILKKYNVETNFIQEKLHW